MDNERERSVCRQDVRGGAKDFFKGFFLTLLILVPVYLFVFFWSTGHRRAEREPIGTPISSPAEGEVAVLPQAYNLLLLLTGGDGGLCGALLLRFDPPAARVDVAVLPAEGVLLAAKRPRRADELFSSLGALALRQAVQETFEVPVSGFMSFSSATLGEALAGFGSFEVTLPRAVSVVSDEGVALYQKEAGPARMSGADLAQYLEYAALSGEQRQGFLAAAAAAAAAGMDPAALQERILSAYRAIAPDAGDIDAAGVHALARAAAAVCGAPGIAVRDAGPAGIWLEDGRFEYAEGCDGALRLIYGASAMSSR